MQGMTEILKGILEGVLLQTIKNKKATYGYEITSYLVELGFDNLVEGTVYTVLLRLEKKGLVTIEKRKSDQGPMRKFYSLNSAGEDYLVDFWKKWDFIGDKLTQLRKD